MNHWNFGVTYLPKAKFDHSFKHDVVNTSIGTSLIYLLSGNVNFMFEALQANDQSYTQEGLREIESTLTLNPGVRFALNFDNLQIVPGISFPYEVLNKEHEYGMLVYLSIEPKFY